MKKVISTKNAPEVIGPYSQAVKAGDFVFFSGQLGINPATGEFISNSITEQTEQIFKNITAILDEIGLTLKNIVKTTVFLSDISNFAVMNEIYSKYFIPHPYPARSVIAVKTLPKNALIEIEVVAIY
ncbi:MAG: RidA family protein [Candidatus Azobacteroides pseudotrichonymphae]|jgi:2-iminobutanoate/2-iminopropanoate deaminase|uniref:YjgF-like translation initiation inhibitor n=1 Tax=Azobacteroides pseudotrichonymphae genomovar. CFP2 TaxID=511995 RepID=B6YRQ1_AZOPC|nr:RidA family protein [Candidatus Azobacteroides pseudotrichonymphae]BAG83873.1 YjgF-like translation initiation inhibitor [Candidatus Azobacteroides pseudotrichonymphae genomovar. CFP2]GMO36668.1 MAG: RidA family protein [Candidatus Azobacteroides pseudotrichonymphae]